MYFIKLFRCLLTFPLPCNDIVAWSLCHVPLDWHEPLDMLSKCLFSDTPMSLLDGDNLQCVN